MALFVLFQHSTFKLQLKLKDLVHVYYFSHEFQISVQYFLFKVNLYIIFLIYKGLIICHMQFTQQCTESSYLMFLYPLTQPLSPLASIFINSQAIVRSSLMQRFSPYIGRPQKPLISIKICYVGFCCSVTTFGTDYYLFCLVMQNFVSQLHQYGLHIKKRYHQYTHGDYLCLASLTSSTLTHPKSEFNHVSAVAETHGLPIK